VAKEKTARNYLVEGYIPKQEDKQEQKPDESTTKPDNKELPEESNLSVRELLHRAYSENENGGDA